MTASLAPTALFGLFIGSFLNVVAWRLPRGESLVVPGSHCPGCEAAVKPWDNVPVLSWLMLRGRCRSCHTRISARYPLVEAGTAALWVAVVAVLWGQADRVVLGVVLVTLLVPIALIDLEHRIIPNRITAPAAVLGVAIGLALNPDRVPEQLIAALAAGGAFFLVAAVNPRGMGMGDVKLVGVLGLYLGQEVAVAVLLGLMTGVIVGVGLVLRHGMTRGRKSTIPFGPFLALGGVVALLAGEGLMDAYLSTF